MNIFKCCALSIMTVLLLMSTHACGNGQQAQSPPVPEVSIVTVLPETITLTTELPGRTTAYRIAEIRPQVSGLIQKRLFTEGSEVKAGQLLYQIDPAPFETALDNAIAALGRAEANLPSVKSRAERFRELVEIKAVSQQDFDNAVAALSQLEAEINSGKAAVKATQINLGYTAIKAPISGRIGRSTVTEGALVAAYQPIALAVIQQMDPIYVDVTQSTSDILKLRRRFEDGSLDRNGNNVDNASLILDDGSVYPLEGKTRFRDITVDPSTGSVLLRIVFPNPDSIILPGMFVRSVVKEGINNNAIVVPQQAVSRDPKGNPYALTVDGNEQAQQKQLVLDRAVGNRWLVSSGLEPGDRVIVEGALKVRPGSSVKTIPFEPVDPSSQKNGGN